jgi:hypothetical protein
MASLLVAIDNRGRQPWAKVIMAPRSWLIRAANASAAR